MALRFLRGARMRLLLLGIVSVGSGLAQAVVLVVIVQSSLAMSRGEGRVMLAVGPLSLPEQPVSLLLGVAGGLVVLLIAESYAAARLTAGIAAGLLARQRRALLHAFLQARPDVQHRHGAGSFQEVVSSDTQRATQVALAAAGLTIATLSLSVLLIAALVLDPVGATAVLGGVLLLSLLSHPLGRLRRALGRQTADGALLFGSTVNEVYCAAREIRLNRADAAFEARLNSTVADVVRPYRGLQLMNRFVPSVFQYAGFAFVIATLAVLSRTDPESLAALGASLLLLLRALTFAQNVQVNLHLLGEATPFVERVARRLAEYEAAAIARGGLPLPPFDALHVEDAHFSYAADRPVLQGLNLEVRQGEAVGLIGPSGSGKSTLALVLLRMADLDRGRLLVDGCDVARTSLDSWYRAVALVAQHPLLLGVSVADNIAFYREGIAREDVELAARAAGIHEEVVALPHGYDTVLDPGGAGLSGGQRQRLAIARALAGRPQVLVLDEPTSALDRVSAAHLVEQLSALKGTVTIILISHQADVVAFCDRVLTIEDGRVRQPSAADPALPARARSADALERIAAG